MNNYSSSLSRIKLGNLLTSIVSKYCIARACPDGWVVTAMLITVLCLSHHCPDSKPGRGKWESYQWLWVGWWFCKLEQYSSTTYSWLPKTKYTKYGEKEGFHNSAVVSESVCMDVYETIADGYWLANTDTRKKSTRVCAPFNIFYHALPLTKATQC